MLSLVAFIIMRIITIHNTHGIEFVDYDISFKGICPKCREKVKEEQHG